MPDLFVSSDSPLLDLLRRGERSTVSELAAELGVTATAVRQRLNRLLGQGLIARTSENSGRGRPVHRYELTSAGSRKAGSNFDDLAVVLWEEVRSVKDPEVRRGLIARISARLADRYRDELKGETLEERMTSLAAFFGQREVPFEVNGDGDLPVLTALACPYPGLAEVDRSVCAMESKMISEAVGQDMRLSKCRLDGDNCCSFEPSGAETA